MFSKKCCICGSSCIFFKNKKIEMKSYLCDECEAKCSRFVNVENLKVSEIKAHIELMAKEDKIYNEYFADGNSLVLYPNPPILESIVFNDSVGLFAIRRKNETAGKVADVFRYDEVESYIKFATTADNGQGIRVFKSDGLLIRFKNSHYAKDGVRIYMRSRESEHDYVDEVINRFDHILGKVGDVECNEDKMVLFTHAADKLLSN